MIDFEKDLERTINRHSQENASNTPDYILAQFLSACLAAWNTATQQRETWYGRDARPSHVAEPEAKPGLCPKCGSDEWVGDLTTAFDFGSQVSCYKCGYFELRDPANEESRVREEERRARWKPTQEPAPARPGTEEVVRWLDTHGWTGCATMNEAIRRVRAHDKLRAALAGMASEYANRPVVPKSEIGALLALLDSEAP